MFGALQSFLSFILFEHFNFQICDAFVVNAAIKHQTFYFSRMHPSVTSPLYISNGNENDIDVDLSCEITVGINHVEWNQWILPSLKQGCDDMEFEFAVRDEYESLEDDGIVEVVAESIPGCEGRILVLNFDKSDSIGIEDAEYFEFVLSQQLESSWQEYMEHQRMGEHDDDNLHYRPILVILVNGKSIPNSGGKNSTSKSEGRKQWLKNHLNNYVMNRYQLIQPIFKSRNKMINSGRGDDDDLKIHTTYQHIEMDGAFIQNHTNSSHIYWDTSDVFILDNFVTQDLQMELMKLIKREEWNDKVEGSPDPHFWEYGGLVDLTTNPTESIEDSATIRSQSWGLHPDVIEKLCEYPATLPSIQNFENILATNIFPNFIVSRMPSAALFGDEGGIISPLTANAPIYGNMFEPHIDADPVLLPSSPYTDIYGKYPNRSFSKPRFVTCLLYLLNNSKDRTSSSAPTKFISNKGHEFFVMPRPGRIVLMDQDITHSVCPPTSSSKPRYSLVWKLLLYPKGPNQNMKNDVLFSDLSVEKTLEILDEQTCNPTKNYESIQNGINKCKIVIH